MGASTFVNVVRRRNAKNIRDAFRSEVERSRIESGRSYSGEIGMKSEFKIVSHSCTSLKEASDKADELLEQDRFSDKWGPAFVLEVPGDDGGWVFFGGAPS